MEFKIQFNGKKWLDLQVKYQYRNMAGNASTTYKREALLGPRQEIDFQ
jgi:hypothetical protein